MIELSPRLAMVAAMVEHEGEDIVSASAGCEH